MASRPRPTLLWVCVDRALIGCRRDMLAIVQAAYGRGAILPLCVASTLV